VIGVCEEDLYVPGEPYIIGYADTLSGTSVISLHHIRQEFYGLPEDESKIYPRLFKEAVHRLAHLFDLTECRNPKCVNYYSQAMLDIDSKGEKFCDVCQRRLTGAV
jgi:archaemetzincin